LLEEQLKSANITVEKKLAPDLPPVMVVSNQIQQVLLNLIINSMEAMPSGGKITIETVPVRVRQSDGNLRIGEGSRPREGVQIVLSDTGLGIPESQRDRIFEPFVSTKENGTGLGLSVSYGIISAHGGTLTLLNSEGNGASFRIMLPEEESI
jgi:signal transduction histidine kinase